MFKSIRILSIFFILITYNAYSQNQSNQKKTLILINTADKNINDNQDFWNDLEKMKQNVHSSLTYEITNKDVTSKKTFIHSINKIINNSKNDDGSITIYFTNHGQSDGSKLYPSKINIINDTLSVMEYRDILLNIRNKNPNAKIKIIHDHCYSGGMLKAIVDNGKVIIDNSCGIASSKEDEQSYALESIASFYAEKDKTNQNIFEYGASYKTSATPMFTSDIFLSDYLKKNNDCSQCSSQKINNKSKTAIDDALLEIQKKNYENRLKIIIQKIGINVDTSKIEEEIKKNELMLLQNEQEKINFWKNFYSIAMSRFEFKDELKTLEMKENPEKDLRYLELKKIFKTHSNELLNTKEFESYRDMIFNFSSSEDMYYEQRSLLNNAQKIEKNIQALELIRLHNDLDSFSTFVGLLNCEENI